MIIRIFQEKIGDIWQFDFHFKGKDFVHTDKVCSIHKIVQNIGIEIMTYLGDELQIEPKDIIKLIDEIQLKFYCYLGNKEHPNIYNLNETYL